MSRHKNSKVPLEEKVSPEFKSFSEQQLKLFMQDPERTVYSFPADLSKVERAYVHHQCQREGLKTKSVGKEPNRMITISKNASEIISAKLLNLCEESDTVLNEVIKQNSSYIHSEMAAESNSRRRKPPDSNVGRLSYGNLVNVPPMQPNNLLNYRQTLPAWNCKDEFFNKLENNQIMIVTSETGSGKTTQFPQFILEDFCERQLPCRIICCQPRRISAVSVAERVAKERGEKVGQTVGYQIKLESNMGPKTSLIYCTNGVLLRTFMKGYNCLINVTHVILDEIHERDKFSDFLMICLKECLHNYPNLKLILMSATMNIAAFKSYFPTASIMTIPGKMYNVEKHYLPDILQKIDYELYAPKEEENAEDSQETTFSEINPEYDDILKDEMIAAIDDCVAHGTEDTFAHVMQLILSESAWIDQQNGRGYTVLMAAIMYNQMQLVEQLLCMGADTSLRSCEGLSASDWAAYYNKWDVLELLNFNNTNKTKTATNTTYSTHLLEICEKILSTEAINSDLVAKVVFHIHEKDPEGSILVFLPGYEDIINCQEAIMQHEKYNEKDFVLFILHSSMQMGTQTKVFNVIQGKQKVILSTNIAETSITIDDIVYVVDSGKMKEKTYDAISGISSLQTYWIAKSNADQRRGRAGRTRPGECYCLYLKETYDSFPLHSTPEIVRVPLHELCLLTKMLSLGDMPIAEFLDKALDKPPRRSVESAISSLISLGALYRDENLTPLGTHILQLSVEPHLGKMLIYSIVLKCLDPILTIVAGLSYKDPFIMPINKGKKDMCLQKRHGFAGRSMSDHMILLKVFQEWQQARSCGREYQFCRENFISVASMEIISGNRTQLLKQLRATGFVPTRPSDAIQFLNVHSESWPVIKAAMSAGMYPNVSYVKGNSIATKTEKVFIHKMSCLKREKLTSDKEKDGLWILYEELTKMRLQSSLRFGTVVTPLTIALMCGQEMESAEEEDYQGLTLTIDNWVTFWVPNPNVMKLRKMVESIVTKKVSNAYISPTSQENAILKGLLEVLHLEDAKYGIKQPEGIGAAPKSLSFDSNRFGTQRVRMDSTKGAVPRTSVVRNIPQQEPKRTFDAATVFASPYLPLNAVLRNGYEENSHAEIFRKALMEMEKKEQERENWRTRRQEDNSWRSRSKNNENAAPSTQVYARRNGNQFNDFKGGYLQPKSYCDIPPDSRFFVVRPKTMKSIQISQAQGTWLFSPHMERKLINLADKDTSIVLFFSVQRSSAFQGIARLTTLGRILNNTPHRVKWLSTLNVPYESTSRFTNALNEKAVNSCEDGQEIDFLTGNVMCQFFLTPSTENSRVRAILGPKR